MHAPMYLLALHDFQPSFSSPINWSPKIADTICKDALRFAGTGLITCLAIRLVAWYHHLLMFRIGLSIGLRLKPWI